MRPYNSFRLIIMAGAIFAAGTRAGAVTAADYANAGLQLYNQKNYSQAIQYYGAALSLDPNNVAALQGRANCYYIQGQYQQALDDYQKVQALTPSPQLSQFIQSLQAKVGTGSAPPMLGQPAAGDSFDQGVALYQQKQYASAIPLFQQATRENPNDAKAFYYLGLSYLMTGDNKDATLNLAISDKKQPNPSVEAYVTQLKARLSPEDQQWVDGQLAASATASSASEGTGTNKKIGVRLQPAIQLLNLTDFSTAAQNWDSAATSLQASDPTVNFTAHVPTLCANIALEPNYRISPNLEIGLPLGFVAAGTADANYSSSSVTFNESMDISAFTVGASVRYLFGTGSFQPYISGGPLLALMSVNYSLAYASPSTNPFTGSANFSGMGFGGQAQLGVDWHLGDIFSIAPFVAYQLVSSNNLTGNINFSFAGGSSSGNATLSVVPFPPYGNIVFPTGSNLFYATPSGSVPLNLDLGGLKAGIQISAFF